MFMRIIMPRSLGALPPLLIACMRGSSGLKKQVALH